MAVLLPQGEGGAAEEGEGRTAATGKGYRREVCREISIPQFDALPRLTDAFTMTLRTHVMIHIYNENKEVFPLKFDRGFFCKHVLILSDSILIPLETC